MGPLFFLSKLICTEITSLNDDDSFSYQLRALVLESQDRDQPQQVQKHMDSLDVHAWILKATGQNKIWKS